MWQIIWDKEIFQKWQNETDEVKEIKCKWVKPTPRGGYFYMKAIKSIF